MLSYVQEKIMGRVLLAKGLKYSECRPDDVENDLFKYHLKFLQEKGLVEKKGKLYFPTNRGKRLGFLISASGDVYNKFNIWVVAHVVRKHEGNREILMQKKLKHPFYGDTYGVIGKVKPAEKILDTAKRKLKEETNLEASFRYIGTIRTIREDAQERLVQDGWTFVCLGEEPTGKLVRKNQFGENSWLSFEEAIQYQSTNITASKQWDTILKRFNNNDFSPFYFIEELTLETI